MAPLKYSLYSAVLTFASFTSALPKIETRLSTEGRRFIVYPHRVDGLWDRINIFISTRSSSDVLVKIYTPMKPVHSGGVNELHTVRVDRPLKQEVKVGVSSPKEKLHDGIVIISDENITVFINNPSSNASGVTPILTHDSLGNYYLFPSIKKTFNSQISILIGNPDGPNTITVTLPPGPGQPALQWRNTHYGPGMSFDILLNQNEFADIKQQDGTGWGDLTGTQISAQKRVAVFSAAVFPSISGLPDPDKPTATVKQDVTIENIPPVSTWGKSFVVTSTPAQSPRDHVRVIAGRANVNIWLSTGSSTSLLRRGDFFDTEVLPGQSYTLRADKPIQVVQYRSTFTADAAPFMFHVPAIENYGNTYTVPIIFDEQGSENYIVLVTHACFADRVFLKHDSDPNTRQLVSKLSSWKRVGNDNYVTSEVKVEAGNVTIAMLESADAAGDVSATVGGFFFGMGPQKAYAASLGLRSNDGVQRQPGTIPDFQGASTEGPIQEGKSSLLARNKFPMLFPLTMKLVRSHVMCHHECWTDSRCFYLAYNKQSSSDRTSHECVLFGPRAECSGFVQYPNYLVYKLHKH